MNILIVGASGGIGLSILKIAVQKYPNAKITATYNSQKPKFIHDHVQWLKIDATCNFALKALADISQQLELIIDATGFLHSKEKLPERSISEFDSDFFNENIQKNTLTSILLAKHFGKKLKSEKTTYFVSLSARIGSISDNNAGGWISYRTSKAALNMALKTISLEWRRTIPNCCVLAFHPGTTDTSLSKPFQKRLPEGQLHNPEFVAKSLFAVLDKMTPADSGDFIGFDSSNIPW